MRSRLVGIGRDVRDQVDQVAVVGHMAHVDLRWSGDPMPACMM
jgi:hypothetical protein